LALTIEIRKDQLGEAEDFKGFLARLSERYEGKWVAISDDGELISADTIEGVYALADQRHAEVKGLFHVPKRGELLLR